MMVQLLFIVQLLMIQFLKVHYKTLLQILLQMLVPTGALLVEDPDDYVVIANSVAEGNYVVEGNCIVEGNSVVDDNSVVEGNSVDPGDRVVNNDGDVGPIGEVPVGTLLLPEVPVGDVCVVTDPVIVVGASVVLVKLVTHFWIKGSNKRLLGHLIVIHDSLPLSSK